MNEEETRQTPENLVNLLDKLVLPPEPAPISMMPQTFGWIVLVFVVLLAIAFASWRAYRRYKAAAYRRAALAELQQASGNPQALAELVRRTALSAYPRQEVAGLYGDAWLVFLDGTSSGNTFRQGPGRFLSNAPYQRSGSVPDGAVDAIRDWILHHKADGTT